MSHLKGIGRGEKRRLPPMGGPILTTKAPILPSSWDQIDRGGTVTGKKKHCGQTEKVPFSEIAEYRKGTRSGEVARPLGPKEKGGVWGRLLEGKEGQGGGG